MESLKAWGAAAAKNASLGIARTVGWYDPNLSVEHQVETQLNRCFTTVPVHALSTTHAAAAPE